MPDEEVTTGQSEAATQQNDGYSWRPLSNPSISRVYSYGSIIEEAQRLQIPPGPPQWIVDNSAPTPENLMEDCTCNWWEEIRAATRLGQHSEHIEQQQQTRSCSECGGQFNLEELDSWAHCTTCRANFTPCGRCSRQVETDELNHTDTTYGSVCENCFDSHFRQCEACNDIYMSRTMTYSNNREGCYCSDCYDPSWDEEENCSLIHDYSYKPKPIFYGDKGEELGTTVKPKAAMEYNYDTGTYKRIKKNRECLNSTPYLGVELEVNSDEITVDAGYTLLALNGGDNEFHAYLKHDGSIEGGFEIVTHPHTLKAQRVIWESFFNGMPRSGMTSYKSGHCGMHVHVSRGALTEVQRRRIIVFLNAPENKEYIETIAQRRENHYSRLDPKKKKLAFNLSDDRYEAYNTSNRNTDEFRLFRGTTRKDRFFKNLEFVDACVQFAAVTNYPNLTVDRFLEFVSKRANAYRYLHNYHIEKGFIQGTQLAHAKDDKPSYKADRYT